MMIFIYSGIFSAAGIKHPIPCMFNLVIGEPCPACGLSRSFSEIIRLDFDKARLYNLSGIPIFLFFLSQLFLRVIFTGLFAFYKKRKLILIGDIAISLVLFTFTFGPLYLRTADFLKTFYY